jgi:hypothetical protein
MATCLRTRRTTREALRAVVCLPPEWFRYMSTWSVGGGRVVGFESYHARKLKPAWVLLTAEDVSHWWGGYWVLYSDASSSQLTPLCTVGIYPLKEGRHEDACPSVDLLSKGRWRGTALVQDRHASRLVKCRAEQTNRNWGGTLVLCYCSRP